MKFSLCKMMEFSSLLITEYLMKNFDKAAHISKANTSQISIRCLWSTWLPLKSSSKYFPNLIASFKNLLLILCLLRDNLNLNHKIIVSNLFVFIK